MFATLPARLALLAILVFSQVVYAGHSAVHDPGGKPDCQICLQSSSGVAALPSVSIVTAAHIHSPARPDGYVVPATLVRFALCPPSRAPPLPTL